MDKSRVLGYQVLLNDVYYVSEIKEVTISYQILLHIVHISRVVPP